MKRCLLLPLLLSVATAEISSQKDEKKTEQNNASNEIDREKEKEQEKEPVADPEQKKSEETVTPTASQLQSEPSDTPSSPDLSASFQNSFKEYLAAEIGRYIKEHPEAIAHSLQAFAEQQEAKHFQELKGKVEERKDQLLNSQASIVLGDPKAENKVVVFYDTNCPHCRHFDKMLHGFIEKTKNVAIYYRNYPILGHASEQIAQVLVAIGLKDSKKFTALSQAIADHPNRLDWTAFAELAKKQGISKDELDKALVNADAAKALKETKELGQSLGIDSTPTVIVISSKGVTTILQNLTEEALKQELEA